MTTQAIVTPELIRSALTYAQYVRLSEDRFAQGRTTSDAPSYNTPDILGYTRLNLARMRRLDKQTVLRPDLVEAVRGLTRPYVWLVLTESWCGDAAQSVPVLHQVAGLSTSITFRLLLRDNHPAVMDAFLTNGGRSIPKLIVLTADGLNVVATWGPRPAALQAEMDRWRAENRPFADVVEDAQRWYNADRTVSTQAELLALVRQLAAY